MRRFSILLLVSLIACFHFFSCSTKSEGNKDNFTNQQIENHKKKEVVVFVYHRFGNSKYPSTNISLEDFERQLSYLKEHEFSILNLGEALEYLANPGMPLRQKAACLTVDDGYKTFFTNALPLLKKYGFSATLFINSESVGGGSFMSWPELKKVHEAGIEIGNHSHSHAYFVNIPASERINTFKKDVQTCQEEINNHLGFYPRLFAYPYGEFDLKMKIALKDLGFEAAAAQNSGVMYNHDNFAIPRFPMAGPFTKFDGFKEKANMKALRVQKKTPESLVMAHENPPVLKVAFDTAGVDLSRYSCFTDSKCISEIKGNEIIIKANEKLKNRRTLYKITAPAKSGTGWYWFSHLWIQPTVDE